MNILLTNDDGYQASGIQELHKSLGVNNQVFLIAP
jgi:broad specificity polyphosphatase/5'/3'-nucleotidase SurE